jgi:FMN-dependent NADH-azoreductase
MNTILHLNSSIFGEGGQSSRLASQFVAHFAGARVIQRDLSKNPLPHLDAERFGAFLGITDVQFVYAEGLAIGEAQKQAAIAGAQRALRELAQPERIAA